MSLQTDRLKDLIEFCQHSARLRKQPAANIASHNNFSVYEHELISLLGAQLNISDAEGLEEIWLSVDRLRETKPPKATNQWLAPWLILDKDPHKNPTLQQSVSGKALIHINTHTNKENSTLLFTAPDTLIHFNDYSERNRVITLLEEYTKTKWIPWATEEKRRRKTIHLIYITSYFL